MVGNSNSGRYKTKIVEVDNEPYDAQYDDMIEKNLFLCGCLCGKYEKQYIVLIDCKVKDCLRKKLYGGLKINKTKK